MKDAIANFITKHPFLTYWLAGSMLATIRVLFRGYKPTEKTAVTTDGEKVKLDKNLEEVEIVEEETEEAGV